MPKSDVIHTFAKNLIKNMFSTRVHRGTLDRSIQSFIMTAKAMNTDSATMNTAMKLMHRISEHRDSDLNLSFQEVDGHIISVHTMKAEEPPAAAKVEAPPAAAGDTGHAEIILSRNNSIDSFTSTVSAATLVDDFDSVQLSD